MLGTSARPILSSGPALFTPKLPKVAPHSAESGRGRGLESTRRRCTERWELGWLARACAVGMRCSGLSRTLASAACRAAQQGSALDVLSTAYQHPELPPVAQSCARGMGGMNMRRSRRCLVRLRRTTPTGCVDLCIKVGSPRPSTGRRSAVLPLPGAVARGGPGVRRRTHLSRTIGSARVDDAEPSVAQHELKLVQSAAHLVALAQAR